MKTKEPNLDAYKTNYVPVKLSNVVLGWSHLDKPDTAFGANKWSADIILTDQETIDKIKALGLELKKTKDPEKRELENVLKVKKNAVTKDGKPQKPVRVVGLDGTTVLTEQVGFGSTANVIIQLKAWELFDKDLKKKVWKLCAYLDAVQILKLVPRGGGGGFDNLQESGDDVPF